jgi:type IV secretion system protein VirB4
MSLPKEHRSLSALLQFLDPTDSNGIGARLKKWCKGGANGWVFDNDEDTFELTGSNIFGFDVTNFIDNDELNTPITMYLFHKVEKLIDGRRLIVFLDEFWKLLADPYFEDLVENKLKTIRKQNGFLVPITQSPAEMLKSRISASLIEQTATKIFLPNPEASRSDYVDGMKLTNREYELIKNFSEKSRLCLIKQGQNSVVAELNLKGFDDELAVLSGNTATSELAERIVEELGHDPAVWLPEFHKQRKGENHVD